MKRLGDSAAVKIGVVVVILIGLIVTGRYGWQLHWRKYWWDAIRRDDLSRMSSAIQRYFETHKSCFPPKEIVEDCGGEGLQPALVAVLCDPETGEPYDYHVSKDCGYWYDLFIRLDNIEDEAAARVGCSQGCGTEGKYNFGVSMPERRRSPQ